MIIMTEGKIIKREFKFMADFGGAWFGLFVFYPLITPNGLSSTLIFTRSC